MSNPYLYEDRINLFVKDRIRQADALRQERTAREILHRLEKQPGLILADEVGMGKTFVALAVAVSIAVHNRGKRPVVVMVPSSLKEKWPRDFELFREKCLPSELAEQLKWGKAQRAVEFLKLLDDPQSRRKSLIFVTHGALCRNLMDPWVMLALIQRSLHRRHGVDRMRKRLCRFMPRILQTSSRAPGDSEFWYQLLITRPDEWLSVFQAWGVDPEGDNNPETDDDPVPEALCRVLPDMDTDSIYEAILDMPQRESKNIQERIRTVRASIRAALRESWKKCLTQLKLKLPLLILDEAHHLKNSRTKLATLFQTEESRDDADEITRGPLGGVFERMLFLTATPFQLGHGELCSVLERFIGISWKGKNAPPMELPEYWQRLERLREKLDEAQYAAVGLDGAWGALREEDLYCGDQHYESAEPWWNEIKTESEINTHVRRVLEAYKRTCVAMKEAETQLRPWVIRHIKPRMLSNSSGISRRKRFPGNTILSMNSSRTESDGGIPVKDSAILPFLLAARASTLAPTSRPVFAEGLASSFEAFMHTRRQSQDTSPEAESGFLDMDDCLDEQDGLNSDQQWYLDLLETLIPQESSLAYQSHPKLSATVKQVVNAWRAGEKTVVFCHYVITGRVLRQRISEAIENEITQLAIRKLRLPKQEAMAELIRLGNRFRDRESPLRIGCEEQVSALLKQYPDLREHADVLMKVVRRNLRTPSFLARFYPLDQQLSPREAMAEAMNTADQSGMTLRRLLERFFHFLVARCGKEERLQYIEAVERIQAGQTSAINIEELFEVDELEQGRENLIPNIRLVNGKTKQETRQRLMLAFNTPFYPEVLIASSVLAEGVDLHLNCRHTIHHDLCWNPSTLEQRTGRIDRIGAKAEECGQPIHVYLPYVAETQDEKMYRVVMDRERWFNVVMGEDFKVDLRTTEKLADRIPFPESAAHQLAFQLGLDE